MAIDHLERAAKDAGLATDTAMTSSIVRAREVANGLLQGGTASTGVYEALKDTELQLRRFGARLENKRM